MKKCIFLDRDGVLNVERGDYTFRPEDFEVVEGVPEAIKMIKDHGYLAIVVTNQAGITRNIYTREDMNRCHDKLHRATDGLIDRIYYSPYHPWFSESLSRKPNTLMIEKTLAKYDIDLKKSWLIGDRARDIECGQTMGLNTVLIADEASDECTPNLVCRNLLEAMQKILM